MATIRERTATVETAREQAAPERQLQVQLLDILGRPHRASDYIWGVLRLLLGWTFLWAFLDKVWGLGFATTAEGAWLSGGSPTFGFLTFATKGPLAGFYQNLAGNAVVDWLFMLGLLAIGLPLLLGIGVRLAAFTGIVMYALMYSAGFILPEHNPFVDEHVVNAVIMVGLILSGAGRFLGFGNIWAKTRLVRKYPVLE